MQRGGHCNADCMMEALGKVDVATWFDLGLMLDRLRDGRATPSPSFEGDFDAFARYASAGVGLVTFHCLMDDVETARYAEAISHTLPDLQLHLITGRFDVRPEPLLGDHTSRMSAKSFILN